MATRRLIKAADFRSIADTLQRRAATLRVGERSREVAALTKALVTRALPVRREHGAPKVLTASAPGRSELSTAPADAPQLSLPGHLGSLVDKRLRKLVNGKEFRTAEDPAEGLHDLRVASRRLRAFVDVFEPLLDRPIAQHAKKPLRRITRAVGPLRDSDVQMQKLEKRRRDASSDIERAAIEHLLETLRAEREAGERKARRIDAIDFEKVHAAVCAALGETVARLPSPGEATARLAWDHLEPFVSAAGAACPPADELERPEELHALRVALKKLRYAVELFEPVLGTAYREIYARLEGLQEVLGEHHDTVVLERLVEERKVEVESRGRRVLASGLGALERDLSAERARLFARYSEAYFDVDEWRARLRSVLTPPPP